MAHVSPYVGAVAFAVVFGIFVAAMVVLAAVTVAWAIRHDRRGREAWRRRMIGPPIDESRNGHNFEKSRSEQLGPEQPGS